MASNVTGVTVQSWAWSLISALPAPTTDQNLKIVMGWKEAESGNNWPPPNRYNPLNTKGTSPGSFPSPNGITNFPTWQAGLQTQVTGLRQPIYAHNIYPMLKSGNASSSAAAAAIDGSAFGTTDLSASLIDSVTLHPPGAPGGTVIPPGTGGTSGAGGTGTTANATGQFYVNTQGGVDTDYWTAINNWSVQANWYTFTDGEILYVADGYTIGAQTPVAIIGPLVGARQPDRRILSFTASYDNTAFQYFSNHKRRKSTQRKTEMAKVTSPTEIVIDYISPIDAIRAGDLVQLIGCGPMNGPWLVGDCTRSIFQIYSELTLVPTLQPIKPGTAATSSSSGGQQPIGSINGYVNPFAHATGLVPEQIDQGVDFNAQAGSSILALGDYQVTIALASGGGFRSPENTQALIVYKLLNGPYSGKYVYVAEDILIKVHQGQKGKAGDEIATFKASPTGLETGWANSGGGPLQPGAPSTISSYAGHSFDRLLVALGCPKAPNFSQAPWGMKLPPGYP